MSLKVYNTLSGVKEEFKPLEEGKARIYVCGVTPYNHPHIGNARPFVTWDVFRRYLEYLGYDVLHVQNFTDVDDKIINAANAEKTGWDEISSRYINEYFAAMDKLGVRRAHIYPRVSGHMKEIVDMVDGLVDKGYAYVLDGSVYYRVEKFPGYGKLSGRTLEDMQAGARVDVDEDKENPMDFALWKAAKPGEPSWPSPWGEGRPGWHIECSAMSVKYLGCSFDFHGGGSDLIFPHHENEIAQSEACTGCHPFVRYWLHNGFITLNEEKMSKSLGNFFLVKDILAHYKAEVLRFFILATHYRSPLDFSDERLEEAGRSLDRLKTARENLKKLLGMPGGGPGADGAQLLASAREAKAAFIAAMDDDFNTALAISHIFALAKDINIYQQKVVSEKSEPDGKAVGETAIIFDIMAGIIGILEEQDEAGQDETLGKAMDVIIALRQEARAAKDYARADALRDKLSTAGFVLEDTSSGVAWKIK